MVVIAEGTRRLLGNLFELKDLGARDLKGIAGPVPAWAALRPAAVESRFEALHAGGLTALVGREEELDLLLRRWSKAKTGEGQAVLLSGEAGIGKSRLTAALLERLATEPHTRLRYFCSPQHPGRPKGAKTTRPWSGRGSRKSPPRGLNSQKCPSNRLCRILRQPRHHGVGDAALLPACPDRRRKGTQTDWNAVDSLMQKALAAAEKVARYRHAQLSAVRLAGDIKAGNNDDVTLDQLLVTIKSEMVKLGPLIGLDPNQLLLGAENRSPVTVNGSEPEASSPLRRRLPSMGVSSA